MHLVAALTDRRWLLADQLGSIIAAANSSGVTSGSSIYSYSDFGAPGGGTWTGSRFRYTGQIALPNVALYHYKARAYDPTLGRFLQTDPIGYAGGMNLYAYVGNDPVNMIDPFGLWEEIPGDDETVEVRGICRAGDPCQATEYYRPPGSMPEPDFYYSWNSYADADVGGPFMLSEVIYVTARPTCSLACQQARLSAVNRELGGWDDLATFGMHIYGDFRDPWTLIDYSPARLLRLIPNPCGCFEEGTLVATPDGLRPIEEIVVGDEVLAWNPETGETSVQRVEALIRPDPKVLWRLEARNADGGSVIFHVTDDHPWFVEDEGWVETQHLQAGQRIETADDRGLTILDIAPTDRVERTYNLTIAGLHTFLVGEDGAVVHNQSLCQRAAALAARLLRNRVEIQGAGGRLYQYDLAGRAHFDKVTRQWLPTPHMRVGTPHVGPNGRVNYTWEYRAMTEADLRTVNNYLARRP